MSQATGASRFIPGPLREVLLLERALRSVETRSSDLVERIRELSAAVDVRLVAAEALVAGDQVAPALVILRDAAHLAAQLVLASRGEGATDDPLARIVELAGKGELGTPPEGFTAACTLIRSSNRLAFDEIPASEAAGRRLEVERAVGWLRGLVEPRSSAQLKRSRIVRLILASAIVLVALVALGGWGLGKVFGPKNIALGKPVTLSSRRPSCGTPSPEGLPGSGAVDGSHSGSYDVCTNSEVNPWAAIDLGQVHNLSQVKVYNRDDCCWGLYDLPAVIELSLDGQNYTEAARQTSAYTAAKPWVASMDGKAARYVRLRVDGPQPREIVITEIEVFGKR